MVDIRGIAPGQTRDPSGFWLAPETTEPSYPTDVQDICRLMEEQSLRFSPRNRAITAAVRRHPPADGAIFEAGVGKGFAPAAPEWERQPGAMARQEKSSDERS